MKLIPPTEITEARLVSSSIPENDWGVWESTTTYWQGARVIKGHRIWESVQANNLGRDPLASVAGWWLDVGSTNRWAMFDSSVGSRSIADATIEFTLAPGRADSLVLLELDAATVTITQRVGSDVISERTISTIDNSAIIDWAAYFFAPLYQSDFVAITNIPVFGESTLDISISKFSGEVSCGVCIVGLQADLGKTLISPTVGINDYSRKSTDDFGNTSLVRRDFAKRQSARMVVPNSDVDRVFRTLAAVRATPAVWVGGQEYSALILYGWFRDFEVDIAYVSDSYCSLTIEGMI
jgi:hypothetical protein